LPYSTIYRPHTSSEHAKLVQPANWAARDDTCLLIKLMPKGVV